MASRKRPNQPIRRVFRCRQRSRFLILVVLCLCSSVWTAFGGGFDPYKTLGVSRAASPDEIKKRYRKLCLQYHPDKNVSKSAKERDLAEKKFKLVQAAYGMTQDNNSGGMSGTNPHSNPFDSNPDANFQFFTQQPRRPGPNSNSQSNPFSNDPIADAIFRAFTRNGSSTFFASRPGTHPAGPASFGSGTPFQTWGLGNDDLNINLDFKSVYLQTVKIPLEDLYMGSLSFTFKVKDNLYSRYRASIRGNMIYFSLFQALFASLPIRRTSNILATLVALLVIHGTTPIATSKHAYKRPIPRGTKGGVTSFKFVRSRELEVIFQIEEAKHPLYRREDNDLYAEIVITSKEAKIGCKKKLEALDPSEKVIEITIPPNKYSYKKEKKDRKRWFTSVSRNSVKIRGRGWPKRNDTLSNRDDTDIYGHGNLYVTVRVQKPSYKKR